MRAQVAALYREICARGLCVGSAGNVSARHGAGMLITPTGSRGDTITSRGIVDMSLDGDVVGKIRPSSEWEMHAAIYRAAPAAMVIVHAHADHATALAALRQKLPAFHYDILAFGGEDVRVAPYRTFGTPELAAVAAAAIQDRSACLLANHGMICHGRDADAALLTALRLEALCRQYLLARAAGPVRLLNRAQLAAARDRYRNYGQQGATR